MIELGTSRFWLVVAAVVFATRVLQVGPRARRYVYLAATAALCAHPTAWPILALFAAVTLHGYAALFVGRGSGAPRVATGIALHGIGLSAVFVASQHAGVWAPALPGPIDGWLARALPLIGLPYIYLRAVHVLVAVRTGVLERPSLVDYATFLVPFHQLVSGPVERFADFQAKLDAPATHLTVDEVIGALDRLTTGLVKTLVIAELLRRTTGFRLGGTGLDLLLEIHLFALYVYIDFSGYMDIVIGVGRLCGWVPPENFNWPYFSRNIIVFWQRWHITLGDWIRDYIFMPLSLAMQRGSLGKVFQRRSLLVGSSAFFVAMVFCGLWHRFDLQFALWGVLHGLGIVVCKLYEWGLKKGIGAKRMKRYRKWRPAGVVAGLLTFHFVSISFVFAFHPIREALDIVGRLFQ